MYTRREGPKAVLLHSRVPIILGFEDLPERFDFGGLSRDARPDLSATNRRIT
jgi:hypothetical protein